MKKTKNKPKRGFPTIPFLLLIIGIVWIVEPYLTGSTSMIIVPVILIAMAVVWVINFYKKN